MWKNLATKLTRQRLVIEGTTEKIVELNQMKSFLSKLSKVAKMKVLQEPVSFTAHEMGFGGWIHWKSSGAHFYSYPTKPPLFTVDIYTCKPFNVQEVIDFTKNHFNAIEIVWKEIEV